MAKERKGYVFEDKDGRVWARFTFTDEITGKRKNIKRRAETRTDARRLLKKLISELDENGGKALEAGKITFTDLAGIYKETRLVDAVYVGDRKVAGMRSFEQTRWHLKPLVEHFGRKNIRDITAGDVQKYKTHRLNTPTRYGWQRAISSVNRELALLSSMFNHAKAENWIIRSPFEAKGFSLISLADEKKRDRVLSISEERRLLITCTDSREVTYTRKGREITATVPAGNPSLKAIIICAVDTAMRKGELLKLQWKDVDFALNKIEIRAFNTKTGTRREVGMTSRIRDELQKLWGLSPKEMDGSVFGLGDFKKSFTKAVRLAKLEDFQFHDLRHTAITRMVASGMPIAEIMKITGHTQMKTFLRYVNQTNDITQRHVNALEKYFADNADLE